MGDIGGKRFPLALSVVSKPCDACKTAASLLFCRTDSTYMCMACDAKLHGANRHERVWVCEVCEQAPASVTCKADAAALCVTCDRDIHSANPLARRHERIPVVPFYSTAVSILKSTATAFLDVPAAEEPIPIVIGHQESKRNTCLAHEETKSSWLPPVSSSNSKISAEIQADVKSIEFLFSEEDNLLGFDYPVAINDPRPSYNSGADSVDPAQINPKPLPPPVAVLMDQSADNHFEIDYTSSNMSSFSNSYTAQTNNRNVSSSTMDFGVVPDGNSMSDMSCPFALQMNSSSIDLSGSTNGSGQASQLMGFDREARVMRYREKRKNRKFEKTIRYASRKAYAERRPRIKGRFVKRTENTDPPNLDRSFKSAATTTTAFVGGSRLSSGKLSRQSHMLESNA